MESEVRELRLRTGITVPCRVHGSPDALPVLLLHAWGESSRSFDRLVPGLAQFRIYAPDLRGHGGAGKPHAGYSLSEQAQDAAAILAAAGVPQASVLGSSSGGYVAQQLAVDYPAKVAALVLAGTPLSLQGRPAFADEVDALTDPVSEEWVRSFLSWFPLVQDVPQWFIEDRVRDGVGMPAHAWKFSLRGLYSAPPPTESGSIDVPTLLLRGGQDGLLSQADQDTLAARIEASEVKTYDAAHLVLWECPEQVAEDTAAFLGSLA
ncbi:alpha/beta fold hydrolase [Arthrobacter yangruifuii]|uniref:alpha/beta fold hydrolase n=1 Tax=Arthrobacter yangruifuii TaxID=2606616 RepID=UPI0011B50E02|nr:alpha/beta hydrolase [Arthrobacter yangruifuii]